MARDCAGALALGCAAGWLHERDENHNAAEVKEFVDGLRQVRREPGTVVSVVIVKDGVPISCRMQRLETPPPSKASPDEEPAAAPAEEHKPAGEAKTADTEKPAVGSAQPVQPSPEGS